MQGMRVCGTVDGERAGQPGERTKRVRLACPRRRAARAMKRCGAAAGRPGGFKKPLWASKAILSRSWTELHKGNADHEKLRLHDEVRIAAALTMRDTTLMLPASVKRKSHKVWKYGSSTGGEEAGKYPTRVFQQARFRGDIRNIHRACK